MGSQDIIDFRVRLPLELRPAQDLPAAYTDQYDAVLDVTNRNARTMDDLRASLTESSIGHAVLHAEYEYGDPADAMNQTVAQIVADEPALFSGFGTVSLEPLDPMRTVRQVAEIADLGLVGVSVQPSFFGLPIDDRALYPLYAKATELGLMVAIHTGINYSTRHPIRNDHPLQLDQVACDFNEGTFIACHAGWPWTAEAVAVARKHPHVLLEFGGLSPRYVGAENSGWGVMLRFMNSVLRSQVLFGTDWPVFDHDRALDEWAQLGLRPETLDALTSGNARRLLAARGGLR